MIPNKQIQKKTNVIASNKPNKPNKITGRASYALLGWMIGDALGVTTEFEKAENARQTIKAHNYFADGLVGGGTFDFKPGQFSDDSEMGLAMLSALMTIGTYSQEAVAQEYHTWYLSNPKDMGKTTRNAVSRPTAKEMIYMAKTANSNSLSNGFLMRLPPMVAYFAIRDSGDLPSDPGKLGLALIEDSNLTHSHPEAVLISATYARILKKAIQGYVAKEVYEFGKVGRKSSSLVTAIYDAVDKDKNMFEYANTAYRFSDIDSSFCGFVGFAFWLVLKCLKNHKSYQESMFYVMSLGGDTDTNCCIVGAVMGAIYPNTIPLKWAQSLLNYSDPERFNVYPNANPSVWKKWIEINF